MSTFTTRDGVELYFKDWGSGQPIVFRHGWPLNADSWESQMIFLAGHGYRCIALNRRGHGRSSQPWDGNDMDHYADNLAGLLDHLDVTNAVLLGFSTGVTEVARYTGRHGTKRVAKASLVPAVPPLMRRTAVNPGGLPMEVFDGIRAAPVVNRSQLFLDLPTAPFYGSTAPARPVAGLDPGLVDAGHDGRAQEHLRPGQGVFPDRLHRRPEKVHDPTLIIHGGDDQVVPIDAAGRASKALVPHATLIVYPGAPHGLTDTHKNQINADLPAFIRE